MELIGLKQRPGLSENNKLQKSYDQFGQLLDELQSRDLPEEVIQEINQSIEALNTLTTKDKNFRKSVRKTQNGMLKLVEKELKLVPKGYYRNMWTALGLSAIGIPIGVIFGAIIGNMGFLGMGIPLGLSIGLVIGNQLDQKAKDEGRQLDVEVNH